MLVMAVPSILLAADVTPAETTAMMQAAETWLLSKQVPVVRDGSGNYVSGGYWVDNEQSDNFASTCFVVAALLENSVPKTNQKIIDAIDYIMTKNHAATYNAGVYVSGGGFYEGYTTYENGAALVALSLYGDPANAAFKAKVQAAYDYMKANQNDTVGSDAFGGFTYNGKATGSTGDLSNTQFGIMGLAYAAKYLGINAATQTWAANVNAFVAKCASQGVAGSISYQPSYSNFSPGGSMTAAGIWILALTGTATGSGSTIVNDAISLVRPQLL